MIFDFFDFQFSKFVSSKLQESFFSYVLYKKKKKVWSKHILDFHKISFYKNRCFDTVVSFI